MRYKEPFTVYPRKMKSGLIVWYYQTYDEFNKRTTARSTGQITKSAARAFCRKLEKEDLLVPNSLNNLTFGEFAVNWWIPGKCSYLEYRMSRKTLSFNYIRSCSQITQKHIIPYFKDYKIRAIKRIHVEKWIDSLVHQGISNSSVNIYSRVFHLMMAEAVRREILKIDVTEKIPALKNSFKTKGIFSQEIVAKLFDLNKIERNWICKEYYYANLLAACTGMRMSEVVGLQNKDIFKGYIAVTKQYIKGIGIQPTKNKKSREIPIPLELEEDLKTLSDGEAESFVFSVDGKGNPLSHTTVLRTLRIALRNIGILDKEQKKANYSFHSWRHYFNTIMRSNNISDSKLQSLTGHSSTAMTDHYTHFNHSDFLDVGVIQAKIFTFTDVSS
jgi:integrase